MLAVTGYRSAIVTELRKLLPPEEEVRPIDDRTPLEAGWLGRCERVFLCAGLLRSKPIKWYTPDEISETLTVNLVWPMQICDAVLERNPKARIVVMGSESGIRWSYDDVYAASKAALHRYVETKRLKPEQQLVCVAPSIIENCGMTIRRTDTDNLERRRAEHPKKRFLKAAEVAKLVHYLLYVDEGYLTGQVIQIDGGA